MATSILYACGLNEQKLPRRIHISEESNIDGTFLISSILAQRLRNSNSGVLLVCLQRDYQHYFNAGMRLGYNANIFLGKTLTVIDTTVELNRDFLTSIWLADERRVTKIFMDRIYDQLKENNSLQNRNSITIIIDNLSILMNLGATPEEIRLLSTALNALTEEFPNLTIITKLNNCNEFKELDNFLQNSAELKIQNSPFKSGVFHEVDGKLIIERLPEDSGFLIETSRKEILYKLNDRNIKIFSPGEVGLKP